MAFLYLLNHSITPLWMIYASLTVLGVARSFMGPAVQSALPVLVPSTALPNAIALNSSSFHLGTITGPLLGGFLNGISPHLPYFISFFFFLIAFILVWMIENLKPPLKHTNTQRPKLLAGINYIVSQPIIFGALSLDLFAVLFAGCSALLPVFAKDILELGAWGLGFLRASPGIGALIISLWLIHNPLRIYIGYKMFLSVFIYGLSIILFSLSTNIWLSSLLLILMGGADMVSVFIRQTLIQLKTPDDVRGRVSAVNMAFIGASNELGEFRAGTVASILGSESAVMLGGVSALGIAGLWMYLFPSLVKVHSLDKLD
ncbi:MAG: MFS transporter [Hyphomicrobium sp.]